VTPYAPTLLTSAFRLRPQRQRPTTTPALIEVYPHPALLVLMDAPYRVQYKVSKAGRYWPKVPPSERRRKLVETWSKIREALGKTIIGAELPLPTPDDVNNA